MAPSPGPGTGRAAGREARVRRGHGEDGRPAGRREEGKSLPLRTGPSAGRRAPNCVL